MTRDAAVAGPKGILARPGTRISEFDGAKTDVDLSACRIVAERGVHADAAGSGEVGMDVLEGLGLPAPAEGVFDVVLAFDPASSAYLLLGKRDAPAEERPIDEDAAAASGIASTERARRVVGVVLAEGVASLDEALDLYASLSACEDPDLDVVLGSASESFDDEFFPARLHPRAFVLRTLRNLAAEASDVLSHATVRAGLVKEAAALDRLLSRLDADGCEEADEEDVDGFHRPIQTAVDSIVPVLRRLHRGDLADVLVRRANRLGSLSEEAERAEPEILDAAAHDEEMDKAFVQED